MPTFRELFTEQGISLENLSTDGTQQREIEHTFYAQIEDLDAIKKLAKRVEKHEQWLIPVEAKTQNKGKMRIRMIDNQRALLATKITPTTGEGVIEVEQDITKDMFENIRKLAVEGYYKTRYTLATNIPGLFWEVDVFLGNGGMEHSWVKVDLEVKSLDDPIPRFPVEVKEYIDPKDDLGWTSSNKIKNLWAKEWQRIDDTNVEG